MTELTIKSVEWKPVPIVRTKKDFENGASEFVLTLNIECEIPKGFEVFSNGKPDIFIVTNGKITMLYMVGYHIGDNMVCFTSYEKYDKEFKFKIYMA